MIQFLFKKKNDPARWLTLAIPALWEIKVGRSPEVGVQDQPDQHGETPSLKHKINQAQRGTPVIPATQEAEAGESLELERQRLQ